MSFKTFARNTVLAILSWEARAVLARYKPRIIAITGSVGKTSTKDAIYAVLKDSYVVRSSAKSFNSEFGVPLTILGLSTGWDSPLVWLNNIARGLALVLIKHSYPAWLILEVGADHPGDIAHIAAWLPVDIAVITMIGDTPVHVEFFPSVDDLVREKASILRAVKKGGTIILNTDDVRIAALKDSVVDRTVVSYGLHSASDIAARDIRVIYANNLPSGLAFDIVTPEGTYPVSLTHTIGAHHTYMSLAAMAVTRALGISPEETISHLEQIPPTPGRLRMIAGIRDSIIIDDTYNASPVAVRAGLETLATLHTSGRKIAVLGDMRELGTLSINAHTDVGAAAARVSDILLCVGDYCPHVSSGATSSGLSPDRIITCVNAREAGMYLKEHVTPGDIIFIKGSQSMRMERAVEAIMAHPEKKKDMLVRQEKEWQKR